MIPKRLTLEGIYSYQNRQTIDFGPLLDGQLFGIFGSVGAGKSTILEALGLALYGETERLNKRDDRGYNMMNLKSDKLLVDFEFGTGTGDDYRFVVKASRNSKRFQQVRSMERSAYKKEGSEWVPVQLGTAEELLGLSYANFKRTIIIPQGKFSEFLQLGGTDRTRMLREIFNLDRFELDGQAAMLEGQAQGEFRRIEGALENLAAVNKEAVEEQAQVAEGLAQELAAAEKELQSQQQALQGLEARMKQQQELAQLEQEQAELHGKKAAYARRAETLEQYRHAREHLKSPLEQLAEGRRQLNDWQQRQAALKQEATQVANTLARQLPEWEQLQQKYEGREVLKTEAEDLGHYLEAQALVQVIDQLHERMTASKDFLDDQQKKLAADRKEHEQLTGVIKAQRAQLPNLEELAALRDWHTRRSAMEELLKKAKAATSAEEDRLEALEEERWALLDDKRDLLSDAQATAVDFTALSQLMQQSRAMHEERVGFAEEALKHLEVQEGLQHYATSLAEGEACPLCGSTQHPAPLDTEDVLDALPGARLALANTRKELEQLNALAANLKGLYAQDKAQRKRLEACEADEEQQQQALTAHLGTFHWPGFDPANETVVEEGFQKARTLEARIAQFEQQVATKFKAIEQGEAQCEKARQQLETDRAELMTQDTQRTLLLKQLKHLKEGALAREQPPTLKTRREALLAEVNMLETKYPRVKAEIEQLQARQTATAAQEESLGAEGQRLEAHQAKLTESFEALLAASPFTDAPAAQAMLATPLNAAQEQEAINHYHQQVQLVAGKIESLKGILGAARTPPEALTELQAAVAQRAEQVKDTQTRLGGAQQQLAQLQQDWARRQGLEQEREAVEKRLDDLKVLRGLFKASGFVSYVSTVYLRAICAAANERFHQLTHRQLSLEVADDNQFVVRDYLNEGRTRSVKTLSGGQLFQASLSLALALAAHVQQGHQGQRFFFLDEGFGSLDKEALQVVFETLKALRREGRVVGVISHVQELQQEIDVYLTISKNQEGGSQITESWLG